MAGIGFGLERIGLLALGRPRIAGLLIAVAVGLLLLGTPRLEFETDFDRTFRAPDDVIAASPRARGAFSDNVTILIDADISSPEILEDLRFFQLELLINDEVGAVYSIFSLQRPNADRTDWEPYFPDGVEPAQRIEELRADARAGALLARLLSADARATAMAVIPSERNGIRASSDRLTEIVMATIDEYRSDTIRFEIAGRNAIVTAIVAAIKHDHMVITLLGLVIGVACGMLVFRSITIAIVAVVPGVVALAALFGFMGTAGYKVTVLTAAVTALVLVISVADTMHVCVDWLRRRGRGEATMEALRGSVREVGPACALTSMTTTTAFLSMLIVDSPGIREISVIGAMGCIFAFLSVIAVFPLAALAYSSITTKPPAWRGFPAVTERKWFHPLPSRFAGMVIALAIALAVSAGYFHTRLTPNFNLLFSVPEDAPIQAATDRADNAFGGLSSINITLTAPESGDFNRPEFWQKLEDAAALAAEIAGVEAVFGLPALLGDTAAAERSILLAPLLDTDSPAATGAVISTDSRTANLTLFIETRRPSDDVKRLADRLQTDIQAGVAPVKVAVGGSSVITARESDRVIRALHRNLLFATAFTVVVIGVGFRSVRYSLTALLPNALPILLVGAWLAISDTGLQFSTAIALIIAFGIAVDDTIHFLNRYRQSSALGLAVGPAIDRTFHDIAVVLMATTLLLCAGLSTTLTSPIPALKQYGYLSIATLVLALVCMLVILPAIIHRMFAKSQPD